MAADDFAIALRIYRQSNLHTVEAGWPFPPQRYQSIDSVNNASSSYWAAWEI